MDPAQAERIVTTHFHCGHMGGGGTRPISTSCLSAPSPFIFFAAMPYTIAAPGPLGAHATNLAHRFIPTLESNEYGERILSGGLERQAMDSPGRVPGQLCFPAPTNGGLISADVAWHGAFAVLTTRIDVYDAPFRQLLRLARLAFPGRGLVIGGGREGARAFIGQPGATGEGQRWTKYYYIRSCARSAEPRGAVGYGDAPALVWKVVWGPILGPIQTNRARFLGEVLHVISCAPRQAAYLHPARLPAADWINR